MKVVSAILSIINEHFQSPIKTLIERKTFAALDSLEDRFFGFEQFGDEGIRIG